MTLTDDEGAARRAQWRALCQNLTDREILYFVSGSPDGVREKRVKDHMQDVFKYSFHGSVGSHLEKLATDGYLSKESTKSGAAVWFANPRTVMDLIRTELAAMKAREQELKELYTFLENTYGN